MKLMLIVLIMLMGSSVVWAHVIGLSPWCLSNSPTHFECFYESEQSCLNMKKSRSAPKAFGAVPGTDIWTCELYPYELIKQQGESLQKTK